VVNKQGIKMSTLWSGGQSSKSQDAEITFTDLAEALFSTTSVEKFSIVVFVLFAHVLLLFFATLLLYACVFVTWRLINLVTYLLNLLAYTYRPLLTCRCRFCLTHKYESLSFYTMYCMFYKLHDYMIFVLICGTSPRSIFMLCSRC